jgi:hypothetical protein
MWYCDGGRSRPKRRYAFYFLLWRVRAPGATRGKRGGVEEVQFAWTERLFKEGARVTHGTSVALTNKGRKLTNRQTSY